LIFDKRFQSNGIRNIIVRFSTSRFWKLIKLCSTYNINIAYKLSGLRRHSFCMMCSYKI